MNVSYQPLRNNNMEVTHIPNNNKPKNAAHGSRLSLNTSAPMAKSESDDEADDREVVTKPYPGVDDGFFNDTDKRRETNPDVENVDPNHPDVEVFSPKPRDSEPIEPTDDTPTIFDRADPGDGDDIDGTNKKYPDTTTEDKPDPVDGNSEGPAIPPVARRRRPSHFPDYDFDVEIGGVPGEYPESIPDVNIYQQKKTLAQGMMDLALLSANANQLRYVLESYNRHPYFYPSIIFISISLILQVAVGIGLIWNGTYNVKDRKEICIANKVNNFTVLGIFLVTIVNVFVSAFGVANPPA